jgi:hypothetical protein
MAASAYPAFIDALASALIALPALSGVNVYTAAVDPADLGTESIMFAEEVGIDQEQAAMSSADVNEVFPVPGWITCFATMPQGADQVATINAAAKTARDAAFTILGAVTGYVRSNRTVAGTVLGAEVTSIKVTQGMAPEAQLGRWCAIQFVVEAEAHTTS